MSEKNPNWSRDEVILALDLYLKSGRKQLAPTDPKIIELSRILNQLPIHDKEIRNADFRNPRGVSMKLGNFLGIDPKYKSKGLKRGAKMDREVWNEFSNDPYLLARLAATIRNNIGAVYESSEKYGDASDEGEDEFAEGKIQTRLHKHRERSRTIVNKKKRNVFKETGKLECEACGFDFAKKYGDLGSRFAECHHKIPLADLKKEHKTRLSDLAILCANCHRMIHKSRPMLTVSELRKLIHDLENEDC